MAKNHDNDQQKDPKKTGPMEGTEYTDEQRHENEVASTAYTGSDKKKVDLQNDRLETGGF
ncbi:hypothetical protein NCCP2716_19320 [Sporosarcina sp. NCCP-2716]|uniref:hypothetical protein n=1 Tax=Sporosarcina sp. NCCP-2716 TaxID=2943679 RepID=UPI002040C0EB|nr:hypothetical protein [Sporosarcina sp. NCCP-2716]GKV69434.1 hypothetical protein NCCP2716_19320 [Sporosarcina sp. NCCP-2716]